MKKFPLLFGISLIMSVPVYSQVEEFMLDGVPALPDAYMTKMTRNGEMLIGETSDGSAITYNMVTKTPHYYFQCFAGGGYPAANNGWVVGADMSDSGFAVVMHDGQETPVLVLAGNYLMSDLHSITPDARRVCGLAGKGFDPNDENHAMYNPLVIDIDENGNFGEPVFLPTPDRDFFGKRPQYCSAVWMSSDGKTVLGQVIENTGMLNTYPIVYRENENGEWSYTLPSESLFNPDNLPMPDDPGDFEHAFPGVETPQYEDFMSEEGRERFREALDNWISDGMPEDNDPYEHIGLFMTPEEISAFNHAVDEYNACVIEYNDMLEKYYTALYEIVDSSVLFLHNSMTLSADGKIFASTAVEVTDNGYGNFSEKLIPWIFDLENGSARKCSPDNEGLLTNHILADGTVIAASIASDVNPSKSYVCLPGSDVFIPIQDYLSTKAPYFSDWMNENLTGMVIVGIDENGEYQYKQMTVTGNVSASDDFETIAAGVDGYTLGFDMYFTYMINELTAGMEDIITENRPEIYKVFNLHGHNVMTTGNASEIKNLPKGIYIVNGKKIAL